LVDKLNKIPVPVLLLLNKMDVSNQEALVEKVEYWHKKIEKAEILPISALEGFNTELILPKLKHFYQKILLITTKNSLQINLNVSL
jgi:GTP-binding protein Era